MAEIELPWLRSSARAFAARLAAGRVPHALLLVGPHGMGKSALARHLIPMLLCEHEDVQARPCGDCRSCRMVAQGTHSDVQAVHVEEGRREIRIPQIRALNEFLSLKSQYGGYRIGLIDPADAMNANAANGLLKTLEEPPPRAVLMLVASAPHRLPATIRSRCQLIELPVPPRPDALAWLGEQGSRGTLLGVAGGAPLRALALEEAGYAGLQDELLSTLEALRAGRQGPVEAALRWQERGRETFLMLLLSLLIDLARLRGLGEGAARSYRDERRLQALAKGLDLMALHHYLDRVLEARRYQEHPLNEQLVLEDLLIGWRRLAAGKAANRQ